MSVLKDSNDQPRTITADDRLKVIGLCVLAGEANRELKRIERAIASVVGEKPDEYGYYGHVGDVVIEENPNADALLRNLKITVEDS